MVDSRSAPKQPKKSSSVRHTRAIQRDRSKRPLVAPPDEQVSQRLTDLVHPVTLSQVAYFHELGLRERVFTLRLMVAIVLSMIWRQIGEVTQVVRLMQKESLLWAQPQRITQQALSERFRTLPAELFLKDLEAVLPVMQTRWQARQCPCRLKWHGQNRTTPKSWFKMAQPWTPCYTRSACCVIASCVRWADG